MKEKKKLSINIKKVRYPELNPIIRMHPNPEILLGHEMFYQEKLEGANENIEK